jgi:hypothetical protein
VSEPMFKVGEVVVCIDAADLPASFVPLHVGQSYCIRSVDPIIGEGANFSGNIHKHAKFCVRLWGITNQIAGIGLERAYAETRFEKTDAQSESAYTQHEERIAA